jgi:hypothetical protein
MGRVCSFTKIRTVMNRPGLRLSMAATNAPSRESPPTQAGFQRGTVFTSSMAPRGSFPSTNSTLSLGMSARSPTCPAYSLSGGPASHPTAILFSSLESSTPKGTSSWWRGSGRSHWPVGHDKSEGINGGIARYAFSGWRPPSPFAAHRGFQRLVVGELLIAFRNAGTSRRETPSN